MALGPPPSQVPIAREGKFSTTGWPIWLKWFASLYQAVISPRVPAYTVATLPDPASLGDNTRFSTLVYVSDETGGAVLAYTDGSAWRRVTDRAVVS